jgi:deazaflavin-dependent oxidoreductase (nitroreductase family)
MNATPPQSKQPPQNRTPGWSHLLLPVHRWLYQHTSGLLGHRLGPQRTLLLTTTGRKTGQPRTQPLAYFRTDDGTPYVIASNWGSDNPPAWYLNVLANPRVRVQLKRDIFDAVAATAVPEVRARLWPQIIAHSPNFARYQRLVAREIPVVLLHPIPSPTGTS